MISKSSNELVRLVEYFECGGDVTKYLKPYICPAGIPTIGLGSTFYEDGTRVKMTDKSITKERAYEIFKKTISQYENAVNSFTRDDINQYQFDSLVDFCYNVGAGALKNSSLLRKVNANPNDPTIKDSFMSWVYGGDGTKNKVDDDGDGLIDEVGEKKKLQGLVNRRGAEAQLYFKK